MLGDNLSAQRPWCPCHLDMQENCRVCQMSYALTASMADQGIHVPPRPDSVRLLLSTLGKSYTMEVLPTMSVGHLKTELARSFDWDPRQINLYVGFNPLPDHGLCASLCTQVISVVISPAATTSGGHAILSGYNSTCDHELSAESMLQLLPPTCKRLNKNYAESTAADSRAGVTEWEDGGAPVGRCNSACMQAAAAPSMGALGALSPEEHRIARRPTCEVVTKLRVIQDLSLIHI